MGPSFLIVVSISEGRNFPRRQDKNLIIEAKFDGELMCTDPVLHDKTPTFNTELAWEVDRKGLQLHRLQRSPIKIQCYAADIVSLQKELIGYLILDIRLAHEKLQPPKWYPLLNSKYQRQRPEILISLHLEKNEQKQPEEQSTSNMVKKEPRVKSNTQTEISTKAASASDRQQSCLELKPQLNVENGVYYIGDPNLEKAEKFIFSVTIAFATNLLQHKQWQLSKLLMCYPLFTCHDYCAGVVLLSKMAFQQEKAFCVLSFEVSRSVVTVQREFHAWFKKDPPHKNNIDRWHQQFVETECLCKGKSSDRPRVSDANIKRVREAFQRSPDKSLSKASRELSMSKNMVWKVLHKRLCFNPYKVGLVQALTSAEKVKRCDFCEELQLKMRMMDMLETWLLPELNTNYDDYILQLDGAPLHFHRNLVQLYPSISNSSGNFYFYYSLFGNDVTTEPFGNFQNPDFPAERASVKIISSVDVLKDFFIQQPKLQVFFCCADVSIGMADIPISHILMEDATRIENHPVSIEGTFEIVPITENKVASSSFEFDSRPEIGICVMLHKLENEDHHKNILLSSNHISDSLSTSTSDASEILNKVADINIGNDACPVKEKIHLESYPSPPQRLSKSEDLKEKVTEVPTQLLKQIPQSTDVPRVSFIDNIVHGASSNIKKIECPSQSLLVPHHFCFTIDLRTLKLIQQKSYLNCFLRYSYPFFGSTVPILTHPCVDVRSGIEVTLPHGYCAFNFATLHHQLESTFKEFPLIIEVMHRDKEGNQKDKFVGSVKLQLSTVLGESATTFARENGVIGTRQITTCCIPVLSDELRQIGELLVVMSLDDLGPTNIPVVLAEANQQIVNSYSQQDHYELNLSNKLTMEKHTKIFEEWKTEQEHILKEKLKQKEKEHMETLILEWKKRDMERELLMQRKLREYQQMEEKLKQALSDIEVRERHLTINENEILRSKADLKHQKEIMEREANEIIKHIKEENEFMIEIERSKIEELQQKCKSYQEQLADLEKKLKERDILIQSMKEEKEGSRESYLQADVKVLTNEKIDLMKKLEKALSSKQRYKDQWGQALRKIAQLEQQVLDLEKSAWLKKEEYEIIHLNKLAKVEEGILQSEKETLNLIKDKISNFTENSDESESPKESNSENIGHYPKSADTIQKTFLKSSAAGTTTTTTTTAAITTTALENDSYHDSKTLEYLQRLKDEKKTLLDTGVYTEDDRIIIELNEHIHKAMNQL
ncbi:centrosomal protein of 120 kDa-like [Centruroides vittatus]|uniref:centrosomal protein of 120 kDa-like n=1 Tax=Centruroides vittatus TaxID=120091 RepID=UPI00350EF861